MLENIPACDNWQCINSFALWISSVGTVSVSMIALWLSIKDRYISLSATFDTGAIPGDDPLVVDQWVYILAFTNIGARPVTITNYEWRIPFQKGIVITFPFMESSVAKYCTKLPIELTDGKGGHLFHAKNFFLNMKNPDNFMYPDNKLKAYLRIKLFRMYMCTSIGKKVKVKINSRVRRHLWEEYQQKTT